jgi:hypothetical protein
MQIPRFRCYEVMECGGQLVEWSLFLSANNGETSADEKDDRCEVICGSRFFHVVSVVPLQYFKFTIVA